jgi:hypothetical protein
MVYSGPPCKKSSGELLKPYVNEFLMPTLWTKNIYLLTFIKRKGCSASPGDCRDGERVGHAASKKKD